MTTTELNLQSIRRAMLRAASLRADRRDATVMRLQERERRGGYKPAEREFIRAYVGA